MIFIKLIDCSSFDVAVIESHQPLQDLDIFLSVEGFQHADMLSLLLTKIINLPSCKMLLPYVGTRNNTLLLARRSGGVLTIVKVSVESLCKY